MTAAHPGVISLLPYVEIDGQYTVSDDVLEALLIKMVKDGSFQYVFYEGKVRCIEDFKKILKSKTNYPIFGCVDNRIMGFAWINDLKDNHATGHFCVFREAWGTYSVALGKEVLKYWFSFKRDDGKPLFDVILGVTPSAYKTVLRFIKQIGFTIVGDVPHVCYNAFTDSHSSMTLSYCERVP